MVLRYCLQMKGTAKNDDLGSKAINKQINIVLQRQNFEVKYFVGKFIT